MDSQEELVFAQHFPFSSTAKNLLRKWQLDFSSIDEEVVERASLIISHAAQQKPYVIQHMRSTDLLKQEIAAYPVAKIILSFLNNSRLNEKFAAMVADSSRQYLRLDKSPRETAVGLAQDLGIEFELVDKHGFAAIPLQSFLSIQFNAPEMKLVNQFLEKGLVYLDEEKFFRFIQEAVYSRVLDSLPVDTASAPKQFQALARQLKQQIAARQEKEFGETLSGKIDPNLFPECMKSLYSRLLQGENVQHMGRFYMAAFLNSLGMPEKQLVDLFRKTPNFDEKIASYQVKRIVAQNYTPASCAKMLEQGFCVRRECRVKHPLSYYRRELRQQRQAAVQKKGAGKAG